MEKKLHLATSIQFIYWYVFIG